MDVQITQFLKKKKLVKIDFYYYLGLTDQQTTC